MTENADAQEAEPTLAAALEIEHRQIDAGIEAYTKGGDVSDVLDAVTALRRHIWIEEEMVFPRLVERGLQMPVFVMEREHGELWNLMDELARRLDEDPATTTETCQHMLALLDAHNSKEEPILYPHVDEALGVDEGQRLREFMETGTLPAGWVCKRAG